MICQEINCPDYLTGDGEPAWCYRAGQPAGVAVLKCPILQGEDEGRKACATIKKRIKK
jgi:hypothetical protein